MKEGSISKELNFGFPASNLIGPPLTGETTERSDQDEEAGARRGAEAGHAADGRAGPVCGQQEAIQGEEGLGGQAERGQGRGGAGRGGVHQAVHDTDVQWKHEQLTHGTGKIFVFQVKSCLNSKVPRCRSEVKMSSLTHGGCFGSSSSL